MFQFPFISNGIWSWWQFSFRFWTKWKSIWFPFGFHDHTPFNMKGNGNIVFSVHSPRNSAYKTSVWSISLKHITTIRKQTLKVTVRYTKLALKMLSFYFESRRWVYECMYVYTRVFEKCLHEYFCLLYQRLLWPLYNSPWYVRQFSIS